MLQLNEEKTMLLKKTIIVGTVIGCLMATVTAVGLSQKKQKPKTFEIQLVVDFGPAGKDGYDGPIKVETGMNAIEAVAQVYPIMMGYTCCSLREIKEINGVRSDKETENWWKVSINGSQKVSPRNRLLREGDILAWNYVYEP